MRLILATFLALGCSPAAQARVQDGVLLLIDRPEVLAQIEEAGFSAPELVEVEGKKLKDNAEWAKKPGYEALVKSLSDDLDKIGASDPMLGVTMKKSHRLFDKKWLSSPIAKFELVGVVNRLDRKPFAHARPQNCGEVRFIYRLNYRKMQGEQLVYTRLPVTLNVVYWADDPSCAELAKKWLMAKDPTAAAEVLKGPLERKLFPVEKLKAVEVNLQAVRWPSTIRRDFGGYAEYLLRVFHREKGTKALAVGPMEAMPDVAKINADPELKRALLRRVKDPESRKRIDEGIFQIDDSMAATKATSVAFHGMARLSNRPYDRLFKPSDFAGMKFDEMTLVKSVAGHMRRLNEMSCVGCHQTRSIAGFHFVGIDSKETLSENAIKVSYSAHLVRDLPRRAAFVKSLSENKPVPSLRPFADRSDEGDGLYGDHCALTGDPTFKKWTCRAGLVCRPDHALEKDALLGVCMNKEPMAGDPCDVGVVTQHANPHLDRVINRQSPACAKSHQCLPAGEGFPDGLCFGECEGASLKPGEACGMIAVGGFNECLAANKPFTQCLRNNTAPISMRACDEETPCRDDFICAAGKDGKGSCIPPYFLFQLRLDGHFRP